MRRETIATFATLIFVAANSFAAQQMRKPVAASPDSNMKLARDYYNAGRIADAIPLLRQALKLNPHSSEARGLLGAALAESGHCAEALPFLKDAATRVSDSHLKRSAGSDGVKCAMEANQQDEALEFLRQLRKDFPHDPEVLYLTVHAFSDLSTRVSQELLNTAPDSYQVRLLNAEALEAQGKWDDAAAEYKEILAKNPSLQGIHYRLGRLLLTRPKTATTLQDAKLEFEAELANDPHNAGAEYVLGELARQAQDWAVAIEHLSRAVQDDPNFVDAMVELGRALISADRGAEAVPPLETAVKLQSENPTAHYLLSAAYRRAGREADAKREMAAFQQTSAKARENLQDIRSAITGRKTPAQTEEPPH